MDALRMICRYPMGSIERFSALRYKYPAKFNAFLLFGSIYLTVFWLKGFEKINCTTQATAYETKRRARRLFIPYSIIGYKFCFPK